MAKLRGKARTEEIKRLQQEYKKLARRANKRMYRLEKLAEQPGYEAILGYAYKNAYYDIQGIPGGDGRKRFPMDMSRFSAKETNIRDLRQAIVSVSNFLNMPTSTKSGIKKIYSSRAKTINKGYGTNFNWEDLENFFESSYWEKWSAKYGSKTALKAIAIIQKHGKKIADEIQNQRGRHKKINISELSSINGYDLNKQLTAKDKKILENLARIYANRDAE